MDTLFGIEWPVIGLGAFIFFGMYIVHYLLKARKEEKYRESLEYRQRVAEEIERRKEEWRKQWEKDDG